MRKYQINIDPEQVNEKPGKNDPVFAVISNRVARHRENLSMSKIIHEIGENGRAFTRALVKDGIRDKEHFEKQIFLVLDFDENPNYKKIKKRLKKYGIPFTFTYKSLRNSDENPKFRAVFVLDDWIREPALADVLNNLLLEMFNDEKVDGKELLADQNCKELARMFLGGKGIIEKHSCARVTVKDVVDGFHRYYKDKKRENYTKRLKTLAKSLGVEVINNRLGIFEEKYVDDSLKDRKMIRDGNNVMFSVEKQKKKKEGEEQTHIKKLPSVLPNITKDTLKEACPLFKEYSEEERKLGHMERYVLATNLRYIKGGKSWFFEHLQKNKKKWEYDWETYIKVHPQVFERYKPIIHTTSQTQKEIDKILSRVRDETVVFSADFERHMSAYEQNKMERNVDEVIDVVSGMKILPAPYMRKVTAGGSIFSNYEISDKRVITEYVDDEDFEEAFMNYASWENNDIPGKVFAAFVMYVEENIQEVTKYLQATKSEEPLQIYCVVIKFLVDLFEKYDISMLKELHLENYISIVSHLNKNQENGDITETFREIMRKEIQKIMTAEKGEVTRVDQQMVYYNDEFIWIPSELLKQILKKRNLLPARKKLLTKLRERKVLVTDVGFTKKLMVANQRFETLQIKREFFTRIGEADIVELGKEYDDGF